MSKPTQSAPSGEFPLKQQKAADKRRKNSYLGVKGLAGF